MQRHVGKRARFFLIWALVLVSLVAGSAGCTKTSVAPATVGVPNTPIPNTKAPATPPVPGTPQAQGGGRDLAGFENALKQAVMRHNRDGMLAAMGESIWIVGWNNYANEWPRESAVDELLGTFMTKDVGIKFDPDKDITAVLGGNDPLALWGEKVKAVSALYSTGWGADGFTEAILIIAQRPDGYYYWDSILFGPFETNP